MSMSSCDDVIRELLDGNERYRRGKTHDRDFSTDRAALAGDQHPIAAVLTCSDSRLACEHLFDQGPGKLFLVRVAGNFLNEDGLASIEFAVRVLGVPVVLVLGHSSCGAISAAIEAVRGAPELPGHLPGLVDALREPVVRCRGREGDWLSNAVRENVRMTVERLEAAEPVIAEASRGGAVRVVGGVFDLSTGAVSLLPPG
jgi:carbonic anhydrase